jgi:hypothetical protein
MTFDLQTALQNPVMRAAIAEQYPDLVPQPEQKVRKYRNNPTFYNGREYQSAKEARRAGELDLLVKAGEIVAWFPQVRIRLEAGIVYVADFVVIGNDWQVTVEDVKSEGTRTKEYRMKRKLFKKKFGRELKEV